ncbi:MAG: hypothetical protein WC408_05630 [Candidatus Micrarchaeia archaeon]|jgi:signal peptidase I
MNIRPKHKRIAKAILSVMLGLAFIGILWIVLSALFSAAPPINYVTSCSMYPEYTRGDVLFVLPLSPSVAIFDYNKSLTQALPWVISYAGNAVSLNESISTYCNNSIEQMCKEFYSNPFDFSETNGPVSYEYANCTQKNANTQKAQPCVYSARIENTKFATAEKPQAVAYSGKISQSLPAIQIIHRVFFGIKDASGNVFYFTKGDANTLFDSQSAGFFLLNGAAAANASAVRGVVAAKIPFAGDFLRNYQKIADCEGNQLTIG